MIEFLRDPFWQFVGAVLALVAIVISILLFLAQRQRKSLAYEVVSKTALLGVAEELKGKLKILYDGKPVRKVHLLILKLINNGNLPILATDFVQDISVGFSDSTRILSAEVLETNPNNLNASVSVEERIINLHPILLNSSDSVTIKILLSQFDGTFNLNGRIVGVKEIAKKVDNTTISFVFTILGLLLPVIGLALSVHKSPVPIPTTTRDYFGTGLMIIGYVFLMIGIFRAPRFRQSIAHTFRSFFSR